MQAIAAMVVLLMAQNQLPASPAEPRFVVCSDVRTDYCARDGRTLVLAGQTVRLAGANFVPNAAAPGCDIEEHDVWLGPIALAQLLTHAGSGLTVSIVGRSDDGVPLVHARSDRGDINQAMLNTGLVQEAETAWC